MPGPGLTLIVPEVFQCDALTQEWLLVNAFMVRPSGVTGLAAVCYVMDRHASACVAAVLQHPGNSRHGRSLQSCQHAQGMLNVWYSYVLPGSAHVHWILRQFMVAFMSQPSADAMKA